MTAPPVSYGDREVALGNEVLRVLVGSTVHGTQVEGTDDRDEMGIYVEPPAAVFGPLADPEQYVSRTQPEGVRSGPGDVDLTVYGLRKWMRLACHGNPSMLLPLFVPDDAVLVRTEPGDSLRAMAPAIVSRQAGHRHLGYLQAQRQRMDGRGKRNRVPNRPELIARYGFDTKYAGHALRLGYQGVELMTTGRITLPMPEADRRRVVAVRQGEVQLAQAAEWIDRQVESLEWLLSSGAGPLPERPDYVALQAFLADVHLEHWGISAVGVARPPD